MHNKKQVYVFLFTNTFYYLGLKFNTPCRNSTLGFVYHYALL
jgi:hypothetical protein